MSGGRKIFDSHFHIFDLAVRDNFPDQNVSMGFPDSKDQAQIFRNHTASEAVQTLNNAGIQESVFVQVYHDCPEEIDWVYKQFQGLDTVKGIVGGLNPEKVEDLERNINKYKAMKAPKFVGIRHLIGLLDPDYLTRPDVHRGLQVLVSHDLTFDLHSYPDTIKYIPLIASKVPKLKMVIDHIAKPYYHKPEDFKAWCDHMSAAAAHPNVYCKLSGLINEIPDWSVEKFKPYVDHCIKVFGVSRCFYGSDWPVCNLATPEIQYSDVPKLLEGLLASLSEAEKDDIFYNNARKFYGLN